MNNLDKRSWSDSSTSPTPLASYAPLITPSLALSSTTSEDLAVVPGDLFQLGEHRLLCGDCTKDEDRMRLMHTQTAQLGLHDPPYGLRARMAWGFGDGKQYGNAQAPRGVFKPMQGDNRPFHPQHLLASGETVVIWGANHFADKLPPSPAWILWDKRVNIASNDQSDGEVAWVSKGNTLRILRHRWNGMIRDSERGIKRVHPTQKPIVVFKWVIEKYTQEGDLVTDWYGGSGTTLIAAEISNRRAYVCEIEPHYCSVIIDRWQKQTGQQARLIRETTDDKAALE